MMMGAGVVLLLGAVGLALWQTSPPPTPAARPAAPAEAVEESFPDIPRVSLADAKAAFDAGTAIFIDVRDESSYADRHVAGARSIPLANLEPRLTELSPSQWIITYCT